MLIVATIYNIGNKDTLDYRQFFNQNQTEFTIYAEQFIKQDKIVSITQEDMFFIGVTYSMQSSYSGKENFYATFEVPSKFRNSEEEFWKKDSTLIKSSKGTSEILLSEYLKLCKMTESEFHNWRMFLKKYKLPYLIKDKSENFISIGLTTKTGYIYRVDSNVDLGYSDEKVVKLNENWFYFDEKAK